MNSLSLRLNKELLLNLMKDFYLLTEIKIALFDTAGNEILAYPESHCAFCTLMRSSDLGDRECLKSNNASFLRCQRTNTIDIYHCHAGLIEATAPLIDNGAVIGYIMFGQVTSNPDSASLDSSLKQALKKAHGSDIYDSSSFNITYKSDDQIMATAKILEACTFYVLLNDMISLQRENFIQNLNSFLLSHLSEDLSIERLTEEFHISKNRLYDSCSRYMNTGIAEHIKLLRINEAKRLLKETDLTIREISDKVGFSDYNYFCRVFKKTVGTPARKYRMQHS